MMDRLTFIGTLAGGLLAAPLAVEGQPTAQPLTIGILGPSTPSTDGRRITAFSQRLRELGWTEGRNVAIEYRSADGRSERFAEIAAEFVRLPVDVIVTWGTPIYATKRATAVIPIVFAIVADPVRTGLVASLARPGGNLTGLSTEHGEMASKRLQLLREMVPNLRRVAIMGNASNPYAAEEMREIQQMASTLGLGAAISEVRQSEDILPAFQTLKGRADAVFLVPDALFNLQRDRIAALALDARLPTMHGFREPVDAGGLLSYGPDYLELFRRTADYVDKILKGAKPADLPIEQPTKFELVINLKTAKALGLTIPPSLLQRADQVIE
jgi:putative tryptophan/tyrosine transport system substrate-binding protein